MRRFQSVTVLMILLSNIAISKSLVIEQFNDRIAYTFDNIGKLTWSQREVVTVTSKKDLDILQLKNKISPDESEQLKKVLDAMFSKRRPRAVLTYTLGLGVTGAFIAIWAFGNKRLKDEGILKYQNHSLDDTDLVDARDGDDESIYNLGGEQSIIFTQPTSGSGNKLKANVFNLGMASLVGISALYNTYRIFFKKGTVMTIILSPSPQNEL